LLGDVTGASATELHPSGSGDLVEQLNEAAGRWRLFPWTLRLLVVVLLAQPVVGAVLLLPGVPGLIWLWFNDRARRTVVAFYDVNDAPATWFQALVDAAQALAGSQALWRIDAAGDVRTTYQYKVNSGASTIVARKRAGASDQPPAMLATNIADRQLPVMLYGELDLASGGGLHWLLQCSQPNAGQLPEAPAI
jgi:hypothetical protein